ncbi:MAG: hypothetical protein CL599_18565 [Alteromonas sp.]|nr:hypothetical protein [Alteromonas sp.]OUX83798.1 MAG: hypothetical protein CBB95_18415 [Alteromonas sp. TMED35]
MKMITYLLLGTVACYSSFTMSDMYKDVAKNHGHFGLSTNEAGSAKLRGECLVQPKNLTFKRKD